MTQPQAAVGMDRLPWLTDEPRPRAPRPQAQTGGRDLLGWAVAAMLLVAGGSYWLGTRTAEIEEPEAQVVTAPAEPVATVRLPEPRATTPPEAAPMASAPDVRPARPPSIDVPERRAESPIRREGPRTAARKKLSPMELDKSELAETVEKQEKAAPEKSETAPAKPPTAVRSPPRLWPATESKGASGRLVQIGAFGSRQQAKLGWRRMTRAYPAVGRLPATVVSARNSRGRRFYRFQIGTTSQAHSEVLCQRMQRIRFSCAVVGLPWKPKVER